MIDAVDFLAHSTDLIGSDDSDGDRMNITLPKLSGILSEMGDPLHEINNRIHQFFHVRSRSNSTLPIRQEDFDISYVKSPSKPPSILLMGKFNSALPTLYGDNDSFNKNDPFENLRVGLLDG